MLSSQKTGSISEKQDDATTEIENWERSMEKEQQRVAKGRVVALMQAGHSWQEASTMAGVQISRSAAYRLLQKVRTEARSGLARWQTWTPCQTARTRAAMAQRLLPR